ncbi:adenylate kinase [Haloglycomyces albus]|uniref:adenylate kinase n=1 Tax=Haloglycomyces albus TaxID=526067 RepID=UPI00046D0BE3|nr:adenylate kinase [Haloglycomyces albus]
MRLVLVGPPGAGKGTQAGMIAEKLNVPAIATGDIFRANVAGETELGLEAKRYMDAGDLVPDEVTNKMVADRLNEADAQEGFLLDGYPRNTGQAQFLDETLGSHGIDVALELRVPDEEVVRRLSGRRTSTVTGKVYHVEFNPPPEDEREHVKQRDDDHPEAIQNRLKVFHDQTAPILDYYSQQGKLQGVDAVGELDSVTKRIMKALKLD